MQTKYETTIGKGSTVNLQSLLLVVVRNDEDMCMIRNAKEAIADERARNILPERPIGWPMRRREVWLADNDQLLWCIYTFVLEAK